MNSLNFTRRFGKFVHALERAILIFCEKLFCGYPYSVFIIYGNHNKIIDLIYPTSNRD